MADEDGPNWAPVELGSLIRLPACSSDNPIPAKSSAVNVIGQDLCVFVGGSQRVLVAIEVEVYIAAGLVSSVAT